MSPKKVPVLSLMLITYLINFLNSTEAGDVTFTGRILDPNGRAVSNALVIALPNMEDYDRQFVTVLRVGEYVKTDMEGKYEIKFNPDGYGLGRGEFFDLYVRNLDRNLVAIKKFNKDNRTVDATLSSGIILTGRIVDINDNPIQNASLSFILPSASTACLFSFEKNCPVSDENGYYEIRALWPEKRYSISVEADGYGRGSVSDYFADYEPDHKIELDPVVLKKADMKVSGTVIDNDGNPVENATVTCYGEDQPSSNSKTDIEGKFVLENVCAGLLSIRVMKRDANSTSFLMGAVEAEGGATDVIIVASEIQTTEPQPTSLLGKSLPKMESLFAESVSEQLQVKKVLFCFWDYQQRPSRNCILQLAEKADELEQKGIATVAIQASKIERDTLDEWLNENNITFPVGMIEESEEETRFNWGVKSLPWLILTDAEHIVTAEGFGMIELEEKISELEN